MYPFSSANPSITSWQGKNIWIIGASSGIGLAVAESLQQLGANLTLSARNLHSLQTNELFRMARLIPMDISDEQNISEALDQINQQLDVVMVFAGTYHAGPLSTHSSQDILQTLNTNLTGVIQLSRLLLPIFMKQGQGHLVLVGSSAAYLPMPNASVYGASKAGLRYFAQSLYTECKRHAIAVSLVSPGFVKTRLTAQNTFNMPSLMTTEEASRAILQGLAKGSFDIAFPKAFTLSLKLINALPWRWRQLILNRLANQESQ